MVGNIDEWENAFSDAGGTAYFGVRGGSYADKPGDTCERQHAVDPGNAKSSKNPVVGFRCCAAAP